MPTYKTTGGRAVNIKMDPNIIALVLLQVTFEIYFQLMLLYWANTLTVVWKLLASIYQLTDLTPAEMALSAARHSMLTALRLQGQLFRARSLALAEQLTIQSQVLILQLI